MTFRSMPPKSITIAASLLAAASLAHSQSKELNIYSARHYPTAEAL